MPPKDPRMAMLPAVLKYTCTIFRRGEISNLLTARRTSRARGPTLPKRREGAGERGTGRAAVDSHAAAPPVVHSEVICVGIRHGRVLRG